MWLEARKREKATQKLLSDHKKRAERRREENRVDPSSFLQIHGLKAKLCLDPSVYKQATNSMVSWQGDADVTIDRFDVRATLSSIPEDETRQQQRRHGQKSHNQSVIDADESEAMRKLLNYERYRLLIQNDLNKLTEDVRLNLVARSDNSSDARLNKLKYNRFGTSGESTIVTSDSGASSILAKVDQPKRGAAIGFNYSSVPPPSCLLEETNLVDTKCAEQPDESSKSSLPLVDISDFDDLNLDQINVSSHEVERISDVVKKFGFTEEEFSTITQRYNEETGIGDILKKLTELKSKERQNRIFKRAKDQDYGPALPPELLKATKSSEPTTLKSPNSQSPSGQRSSSDTDIPMKNGISSLKRSSSPMNPRLDTNARLTSPLEGECDSVESDSHHNYETMKKSSQSSHERISSRGKHEKPSSSIVTEREPPTNRAMTPETDTKVKYEVRDDKERSSKRASTPLAYKRNRRSSRSISRERRMRRRSRSYKSPERRRRRSRSRSYSSNSSSDSSYTTYRQSDRRSRHRSSQRVQTDRRR